MLYFQCSNFLFVCLQYLKSKVKKIPELDDDDADVPPKQAAAPEPQSEVGFV